MEFYLATQCQSLPANYTTGLTHRHGTVLMKKISELEVGDRVNRYLHVASTLPPMSLFVIHVTSELVCCSLEPNVDYHDPRSQIPVWEFARQTGEEHDPEISALMGGESYTVSHIEPV